MEWQLKAMNQFAFIDHIILLGCKNILLSHVIQTSKTRIINIIIVYNNN